MNRPTSLWKLQQRAHHPTTQHKWVIYIYFSYNFRGTEGETQNAKKSSPWCTEWFNYLSNIQRRLHINTVIMSCLSPLFYHNLYRAIGKLQQTTFSLTLLILESKWARSQNFGTIWKLISYFWTKTYVVGTQMNHLDKQKSISWKYFYKFFSIIISNALANATQRLIGCHKFATVYPAIY